MKRKGWFMEIYYPVNLQEIKLYHRCLVSWISGDWQRATKNQIESGELTDLAVQSQIELESHRSCDAKKPRVGERRGEGDGLPGRRRRSSSRCWLSGIDRAATPPPHTATQPPRAAAPSPHVPPGFPPRVHRESEPSRDFVPDLTRCGSILCQNEEEIGIGSKSIPG
jgi:hypothetical protein